MLDIDYLRECDDYDKINAPEKYVEENWKCDCCGINLRGKKLDYDYFIIQGEQLCIDCIDLEEDDD